MKNSTEKRSETSPEGYAPVRVLGVGNVLTGDDGLGPTIIAMLQAGWEEEPGVSIIDVGTPGLDLTPYLEHARAVLVVDTVRGDTPGVMKIWRNEELLHSPPIARTNPHEPGLREALMATELTDSSPQDLVLIGVVPESTAAGTTLSKPVAAVIPGLLEKVLEELEKLGFKLKQRHQPLAPDLWWH